MSDIALLGYRRVTATGFTTEYSSNTRFQTQDGMTLLMAASKHKKTEMVKWLLGRNAVVNQKNETQTVRAVA